MAKEASTFEMDVTFAVASVLILMLFLERDSIIEVVGTLGNVGKLGNVDKVDLICDEIVIFTLLLKNAVR